VNGVRIRDAESGAEAEVRARVVVNATGAWVDGVRKMAEPDAAPMIAPSQGVHIVLDRSFLPGTRRSWCPGPPTAGSCSRSRGTTTSWSGRPTRPLRPELEPVAREEEIDFLLETAAQYLDTTRRGPT
jgi:glycerol-3-phosphate dehydrogenase